MNRTIKTLFCHRYVKELMLGLAFLLVPFAVCFFPLVIHPTDILTGPQRGGFNDVVLAFMRFRDLPTTITQRYEQFPGWNPYMQLGMPLHGNPQASLFYIPNWLFYIFSAKSAISWMLVLHHVWAALGTFLLCRVYGLRRAAATLGGVVFMAAPFYVAQTGEGHYNSVCLVAWIPWAFLLYERFIARKPLSAVGLIASLSMCFFCGHAQEFFYLVFVLTACVLAAIVRQVVKRDLPSAAHLLLTWTVIGVGTLGIVAVELVPNAEYANQSVRHEGIDAQQASGVSVGIANLKQLVNPTVMGGPVTYEGPGDFYWETICYFGIAPLLLAVAGVVAGAGTETWTYKYWGITVLGLCFAFGDPNPVFVLCYDWIPGLAYFRAPSRALFFVSFSVAVLAALGADSLSTRFDSWLERLPRKDKLIKGVAVIAALLIVTFLALGYHNVQPQEPAPRLLAICLIVGAACCVASVVGQRLIQGSIAGILLIGIVTCDLAMHSNWVLATIPTNGFRQDNRITKAIKSRTHVHDRILADQRLVSDRESCGARVCRLRGYEPVPLKPYAEMMGAIHHNTADEKGTTGQKGTVGEIDILGFRGIQLAKLNKPLIDLAGIRLAICGRPQRVADSDWQLVDAGKIRREVVLAGGEAKAQSYFVYENRTALPRAFIVGDVRHMADPNNRIALLRTTDFRSAVILDADVLPDGERTSFSAAKIVSYTPNEIVVDAELDAPGYLILTDLWYPGWQARTNGAEIPVLQANGTYRAIPLDGGKHRVTFSYRPVTNRLAGCLTFGTLIMLICGQLWHCRVKTRVQSDVPDRG